MGLRVHLINPSDLSFGVAAITPRWLYVLAAATGSHRGDPHLVDETLDQVDPGSISRGDVVGIGIHTGNALRGYEIGRLALERGARVVFGGTHATLFPEETREQGAGEDAGRQHFQRDVALEVFVARAIDRAHPPGANRLQQAVVAEHLAGRGDHDQARFYVPSDGRTNKAPSADGV